jgi:hypothetical protein
VKAEAALKVAGGLLLVRVRRDQRRVEVEHDPLGPGAEHPGPLARPGTRRAQPLQHPLLAQRVDHPPGRRVRGHATEQVLLVAQRAEIRQAVAAVGQHYAQVTHDLAGSEGQAPLARRAERLAEAVSQAQLVRHRDQQRAPGMRGQPLAVRGHFYLLEAASALHLQGDPPEPGLEPTQPEESLLRRTKP